jgi:2,3-bisphosphoglycerate-dependent phosphoglycerate mutase
MDIILEETTQTNLTIERSAALNERYYGDLQGMNKHDAERQFGQEQVFCWRRGYSERPPNGESLADTHKRVVAYFTANILPRLQKGENVLLAAHGNSLRALMMQLENISPKDIEQVELATGVPRQYTFDPEKQSFTWVKNKDE